MGKDVKLSTTESNRSDNKSNNKNVELMNRRRHKRRRKGPKESQDGKSIGSVRMLTGQQDKNDLVIDIMPKEAKTQVTSGLASRRQTGRRTKSCTSDRKNKQFWGNLAESEKRCNFDFSSSAGSSKTATKVKKGKPQCSTIENSKRQEDHNTDSQSPPATISSKSGHQHQHMPRKRKRNSIDSSKADGRGPNGIDPATNETNYAVQHTTSGKRGNESENLTSLPIPTVTPEKTNNATQPSRHTGASEKPRKTLVLSPEEKPSKNVANRSDEVESESSVKTTKHSNKTSSHSDHDNIHSVSSSSTKPNILNQINVPFGELGQVVINLTNDLVFKNYNNYNTNQIKNGDMLVKINDTNVEGWIKEKVLLRCLEEINMHTQRGDNNDQQRQEQPSLRLFFRRGSAGSSNVDHGKTSNVRRKSSASKNDLEEDGQENTAVTAAAAMRRQGNGKKVQQQQQQQQHAGDHDRVTIPAAKVAHSADPSSNKQLHHITTTATNNQGSNKEKSKAMAKDITATTTASSVSKSDNDGPSAPPTENKTAFGLMSNPILLKTKEEKIDRLRHFEKQMNVCEEGKKNALNGKVYGLSRIAVGSKVFTDGCQVSLDGDECSLALSYEQTLIARNFRETTRTALNIPLTEYTFMSGKVFGGRMYTPRGFYVNNSKAFGWTGGWIALNILTNPGDDLSRCSKIYKPESSENKTKYIILEFPNYYDAGELVAGLGTIDHCSSKLEILVDDQKISECSESLIDYQKKHPLVGYLPSQPKQTTIEILGDFRPASPPPPPARVTDYIEGNQVSLKPTVGNHSEKSFPLQEGDQQQKTTASTIVLDRERSFIDKRKAELKAQNFLSEEAKDTYDIKSSKDNGPPPRPFSSPPPHANETPAHSIQQQRPDSFQQLQIDQPASVQQQQQQQQLSASAQRLQNIYLQDARSSNMQQPNVLQRLQNIYLQDARCYNMQRTNVLQRLQNIFLQQQQQASAPAPSCNMQQPNVFQQQQHRRKHEFPGTTYGDEISERAWSLQLPDDDVVIRPYACHSQAAARPAADFLGSQIRGMAQPQVPRIYGNNLSEQLLGNHSLFPQDASSPNNGIPDMCHSHGTTNEGNPPTEWL